MSVKADKNTSSTRKSGLGRDDLMCVQSRLGGTISIPQSQHRRGDMYPKIALRIRHEGKP